MKNLNLMGTCLLFILLTACQQQPIETPLTGYIEAEMRLLAAPQSGWLQDMNLQVGDAIHEGQLLFELDTAIQMAHVEIAAQNLLAAQAHLQDLQKGARPQEVATINAQLLEAQAKKTLAHSELQRLISLADKGLSTAEQLDQAKNRLQVSQAQIDAVNSRIEVAGLGGRIDALVQAEANMKRAQAQLSEQQYQLSQRRIISPFNGPVQQLMYHQGEYIQAGAAVLSVRMLGQDKVRFHIPQEQLTSIALGQNIEVKSDGMNQAVTAIISYISSTAEFTPPVIYSAASRAKLVFLVEAQLASDHPLQPGLPVDVLL